jgi:hypothetical protein
MAPRATFIEINKRTIIEMEVGMRRQKLYETMEKLDEECIKLRAQFPKLNIDQIVKNPYSHVTLTVQSRATNQAYEIVDPIEGFPSDYCVAQIALLS